MGGSSTRRTATVILLATLGIATGIVVSQYSPIFGLGLGEPWSPARTEKLAAHALVFGVAGAVLGLLVSILGAVSQRKPSTAPSSTAVVLNQLRNNPRPLLGHAAIWGIGGAFVGRYAPFVGSGFVGGVLSMLVFTVLGPIAGVGFIILDERDRRLPRR